MVSIILALTLAVELAPSSSLRLFHREDRNSPTNTVCKISGLGMSDNDWTVDSIRPFVLHCIESFGVDRCIFGTNWPVDSLFSGYDDIVDAYTEIISDFSEDEQIAMFSRNAELLYNI